MAIRAKLRLITTVLAVIFTAFQIYGTAGFAVIDSFILRGCHLSLVMTLIFLWIPMKGSWQKHPENEPVAAVIIDLVLAAAALATSLYFIKNAAYLGERFAYVDELTTEDIVCGTATVLMLLECTRRTAGLALSVVAVIFIAYCLGGEYMPAALRHNMTNPLALLEQMFVVPEGIYGVPLSAAVTMIFAFVMFGAVLETSGMNNLFMDIACYVTRNSRGGPAKVAIFASALFGSISGSAPANVYGTGTFTIPLMKRTGYKAHFAGAVEAAASTGGQIMPPVMGAVAFIMADMTGLGYFNVAKAALIPALLYYFSLYCMIHFEAVKNDLGTLPPECIPNPHSIMHRLHYLTGIILLIYLLIAGYTVTLAAFIATAVSILICMFSAQTRYTPARLVEVCVVTCRNCLMVSTCCACAGIVVAVITMTGLGFKFMTLVTIIAGNSIFITAVAIMIACIILGMGVPTAPAYILVAAVASPILIKQGISVIAAHMFVLYYAVLSAITPPVCLAAYAGAAVADANSMKTGITSMYLGLIAFIVPYFFIYEEGLLMQGNWIEIGLVCLTSCIGIISMTAGMQGYLRRKLALVQRVLLIIGGPLLIFPGTVTDLIGIACVAFVLIVDLFSKKTTASV